MDSTPPEEGGPSSVFILISSLTGCSATADWQSCLSALANYVDYRLLAPYNYHYLLSC